MSAVEPCGILSAPVHKTEQLLAQSQTFQHKVKAGTPEDARRFIHVPNEDVARWFLGLERPAAVVSLGNSLLQRTTGYYLRPEQRVVQLLLTDFDCFPESRRDSFYDFTNFAGGVLADLANGQAEDCNLTIDKIIAPDGPLFTHPNRQSEPDKNYWLIFIDIYVSDK